MGLLEIMHIAEQIRRQCVHDSLRQASMPRRTHFLPTDGAFGTENTPSIGENEGTRTAWIYIVNSGQEVAICIGVS